MKKIILSTVALAFATIASAQTFSIQYPTMDESTEGTPGTDNPATEAIQMHNFVINESDAVIENLKFKFEEVDLPFGWSLEGFCNNITCYPKNNIDQFIANDSEVPFLEIEPGETSELEPRIYVPEYADDGIGTVRVNVFYYTDDTETEIAEEHPAIFILRKGAAGVEIIDLKDERVAVFPNPGNEQLFIYTDLSLDARSFQVYDLMGRIVLSGDINDETTNIDATTLQTGHYLIKVLDAKSNSITTRKWMKN